MNKRMGDWKLKKLKREQNGRKNTTASKKARIYYAYPPEGGWPGGAPEANGLKRGGGR